jgi:hypothetical protein
MLCEQIAEPDVVVEHLGAWAEPEEETDEDRQQEIEYVAAMPVMGDEEEDKEEAAPQESSGQPAELNPQAFDPDMASVLGQAGGPEPFETTNAEQPAEAQDESRPEEGEVVEEDEEIEEAGFVAAAEEPPGKAADEPATPEEPSAPGPGTEASIEQQAEPFRPIEDDEELPEAEPQAGPEDQSENLAAMQEFPAPSFSVGEETEYPVADEEETSGPGEDIPLKPSEAESLETEPEEGAAADAEERADASESDAGEEAPEESEDTGGIEVSPDAVYPLEDLEEREAGEKPQEEGEDVK